MMVDTLENNYLATLVVWLGCSQTNSFQRGLLATELLIEIIAGQ